MIKYEVKKEATIDDDEIFKSVVEYILDEEVGVSFGTNLYAFVYNLPVDVQQMLFKSIGLKLVEFAEHSENFEELPD